MDATASYFFEKAEHYRLLAAGIPDHNDRTRLAMLALADQFEAKAQSAIAERRSERNGAVTLRDTKAWMAI